MNKIQLKQMAPTSGQADYIVSTVQELYDVVTSLTDGASIYLKKGTYDCNEVGTILIPAVNNIVIFSDGGANITPCWDKPTFVVNVYISGLFFKGLAFSSGTYLKCPIIESIYLMQDITIDNCSIVLPTEVPVIAFRGYSVTIKNNYCVITPSYLFGDPVIRADSSDSIGVVYPAWNSSSPYIVDDKVSHAGSSWICLVPNTNREPGVTGDWESFSVIIDATNDKFSLQLGNDLPVEVTLSDGRYTLLAFQSELQNKTDVATGATQKTFWSISSPNKLQLRDKLGNYPFIVFKSGPVYSAFNALIKISDDNPYIMPHILDYPYINNINIFNNFVAGNGLLWISKKIQYLDVLKIYDNNVQGQDDSPLIFCKKNPALRNGIVDINNNELTYFGGSPYYGWDTVWDIGTPFLKDTSVVKHSGFWWACLISNTGIEPGTAGAELYWQKKYVVIDCAGHNSPDWDIDTVYNFMDEVFYAGQHWVSLYLWSNVGQEPGSNPGYWGPAIYFPFCHIHGNTMGNFDYVQPVYSIINFTPDDSKQKVYDNYQIIKE